MSEPQGLRILVVDPDSVAGQKIAMSLDAAGFDPQYCAFDGRALNEALKKFSPQLFWVRAELASDLLGKFLTALATQTAYAQVPIVLLCKDVRDAAYVRPMKTGVVELLQLPFSPRLHVARLRLLPREIPERRGEIRGAGNGRELQALLEHLVRARRSGLVTVTDPQGQEGRIFFLNGAVKNSAMGTAQGAAGLAAMTGLQSAIWQFSEGADGAGQMFDMDSLPSAGDDAQPGTEENLLEFSSSGRHDEEVPVVAGMAPAEAPPSAAVQEAPSVSAARAEPAHNTPVLFVDDDPALSQLFQTFFSKKGYLCEVASDGIEAMQKLLRAPYEIVIADLNMPRLDGWGLLRALREDARTQETPVALFSCHDDYRDALRAMHAGAQAYYPKSLRMNALEVQVRELLEPRRRFERVVAGGQSVTTNLSALGAQWVLKVISRLKITGRLDATDSWATFRLHFSSGELCSAMARVENQALSPDQALAGFVSGRGIEGSMAFGGSPIPSQFGGKSTAELLQILCVHLNENKRRIREESQAGAQSLEVNSDLYQLYASVGPPPFRPIAQLLCEQKLLPRDVMARLRCTPQEVAQVVSDLILRGVVSWKS